MTELQNPWFTVKREGDFVSFDNKDGSMTGSFTVPKMLLRELGGVMFVLE